MGQVDRPPIPPEVLEEILNKGNVLLLEAEEQVRKEIRFSWREYLGEWEKKYEPRKIPPIPHVNCKSLPAQKEVMKGFNP